jgi:DNA-damage-inducible protein J
MDKDLKEQADKVFGEIGMSLTTAFNIFVRQTLRQGKIPFEIYTDPFYSEANIKHLEKSIKQMEQGDIVIKTMVELEAMSKDE